MTKKPLANARSRISVKIRRQTDKVGRQIRRSSIVKSTDIPDVLIMASDESGHSNG